MVSKATLKAKLKVLFLSLPGKLGNGVPSAIKQKTNHLEPLDQSIVPSEKDAVSMYESQGGKLQRKWWVGEDALSGNLVQHETRKHQFLQKYSFEDIFTAVVEGNDKPFKKGLKFFMSLSLRTCI